jgi:membrane-associated phospholipid phosphatase
MVAEGERFAPVRARWWARASYYVGPDLLFLGAFIALLAILCVVYDVRWSAIHGSTWMPLVVMVALIGAAFVPRLRGIVSGDRAQRREFAARAMATVRDWSPLILIIAVYDNFHDLTKVIRPQVVDGLLRHLDERLFSVEPTLLLQKITVPWLTEYMTFAYALFFVFPTIILGALYLKDRFIEFREFGLAMSLAFYLGLIGYMLVPAIGPRYAMPGEFTVPLTGYLLTAPAAAAWRSVQQFDRDCFPSLHTAMSSISLVYFWRFRARLPWGRPLLFICAPLIVSLWLSTLYLRYHYAVDVLAGWGLAALCCVVAPATIRWYYAGKFALAAPGR